MMPPAEELPIPLRIHVVRHFVQENGDRLRIHASDRPADRERQRPRFVTVRARGFAGGVDHACGDAKEGARERGRHAGTEVEGEV